VPETQDWGVAAVGQAVLFSSTTFTLTEAGISGTFLAGTAGQRIYVVHASLEPFLATGPSFWLRDQCILELTDSSNGQPAVWLSISPESPSDRVHFAQGAVVLAVAANLNYVGSSRLGAGAQNVAMTIAYYKGP
jgi:hypothetical protein